MTYIHYVVVLTLFDTGNKPVCDGRFDPVDNITVHMVLREHFFRITRKLTIDFVPPPLEG